MIRLVAESVLQNIPESQHLRVLRETRDLAQRMSKTHGVAVQIKVVMGTMMAYPWYYIVHGGMEEDDLAKLVRQRERDLRRFRSA